MYNLRKYHNIHLYYIDILPSGIACIQAAVGTHAGFLVTLVNPTPRLIKCKIKMNVLRLFLKRNSISEYFEFTTEKTDSQAQKMRCLVYNL